LLQTEIITFQSQALKKKFQYTCSGKGCNIWENLKNCYKLIKYILYLSDNSNIESNINIL